MALQGHVAGLAPLADPEWRRKLWRVGWWLFVPVLGWPAVLGYRTRFVRHLLGAPASILPEPRGAFLECAGLGLRAMGVIFGYLTPVYVALFATVWARGWSPGPGALWMALAMAVCPMLSTLSLPLACLCFAWGPGPWITPIEGVAMLVGYALVIFVVPAGFLRVSVTGRYRSAFDLPRSLSLPWRQPGAYCEAWLTSGCMVLVGQLAMPVAPWGVAWSYLGSIVSFNEILLGEPAPARPAVDQGLRRLLSDPRFTGRGRIGRAVVQDAQGERVAILDLGAFSAPLPWRPR